MARKSKTKTIGGVEYTATAIGARSALRVSMFLARILAPLSRGVADKKPGAPAEGEAAAEAPKSLMDINLDDLPIERIIDRLAEPQTLEMVMLMMQGVAADGRDLSSEDTFDSHFAGRIGELAQVVLLCLEVNFGDFFERLGATAIGAQIAKKLGDEAAAA